MSATQLAETPETTTIMYQPFIPPLHTKDIVEFSLDRDLVLSNIKQIQENNTKNSYDEVCGNLVIKDNKLHMVANSGKQGGTEDARFFCEPLHKIYNIVFHTHPIDPIPSGEDLIIVALNDCVAESTQSHVEFLFTPYGVWVFHRTVRKNNKLFKPYVRKENTPDTFIDNKIAEFQKLAYDCCRYIYSEKNRGVPIRMNTEDKHRMGEYVSNIPKFYKDMLKASKGRVSIHWYPYPENPEQQDIVVKLPKVLLEETVVQFCSR